MFAQPTNNEHKYNKGTKNVLNSLMTRFIIIWDRFDTIPYIYIIRVKVLIYT